MKLKFKGKKIPKPIIFFILILILAFSIFKSFNYYYSLNSQRVVDSISYKNTGSLKYNVCLVENKFIEQECFTENRSFVTSLVDHIEIIFDYSSIASDYADYNFDYIITASIVANERGDKSKIVYDKEETLLKDTLIKPSITSFNINKKIKIDYQRYNNLITEFKRNYVLALDSSLIIKAKIEITGKAFDIDKNIKDSKEMNLVIPLSEQTINIETDKSTIEGTGRINQTVSETNTQMKYILFDIYSIFAAISFILLITLIIKSLPNKSEYHNKIRRILREYDGAIAITKSMPDIANYVVIEINTFEEMLDVRNNLEKPILFYEDEKKKYSKFIILNTNEVYICEIRDIENKKSIGKNNEKKIKK